MKVGNLVHLDKEQFYEWDEHIGIIVEIIATKYQENMIRVVWADGEQQWYMYCELEAVS